MSLCGILWRHHADSSFGSRPNLIIRGGDYMNWGNIILGAAMILGEVLGGGDDD